MFRGIEIILQGRDPRDAWAFTQRICGVCTTVHAIASRWVTAAALQPSLSVMAERSELWIAAQQSMIISVG